MGRGNSREKAQKAQECFRTGRWGTKYIVQSFEFSVRSFRKESFTAEARRRGGAEVLPHGALREVGNRGARRHSSTAGGTPAATAEAGGLAGEIIGDFR